MDAAILDTRQQRGLALSKAKRIKQIVSGTFFVPSQSGVSDGYVVDTDKGTCTCPDFDTRMMKCKHMWAVSYARHEVTAPDGSTTVVETMRMTYGQDWPAYKKAKMMQGELVPRLLRGLCDGIIVQPPTGRFGRPRNKLADIIHAAAMKVYLHQDGLEAASTFRDHAQKGLLSKYVSPNSLFDYMQRPELTPLLQMLIQESVAPLAAVDPTCTYGVDATGFGCQQYERWFDHKYCEMHKGKTWVKLHVMGNVAHHGVTAAIVTEGTKSDNPRLRPLVDATVARYPVNVMVADGGYTGMPNFTHLANLGIATYIPFAKNHQGEGPELWRNLWHYHSFHRREFLDVYHKRSNIETVMWMIKKNFGFAVASKKHESQVNEVLLKVLCHNLSCVVQSIYEFGVEPKFWSETVERPMVALA